jgi:hypothetical protein
MSKKYDKTENINFMFNVIIDKAVVIFSQISWNIKLSSLIVNMMRKKFIALLWNIVIQM